LSQRPIKIDLKLVR